MIQGGGRRNEKNSRRQRITDKFQRETIAAFDDILDCNEKLEGKIDSPASRLNKMKNVR